MRSKRGQFFGVYLVLLTAFMCASVIVLYVVQQDNAASAIVSPVQVLELRDDLTIFEIREFDLINRSVEKALAGGDFKSRFESEFYSGFGENENMKEFIFRDLYLNGRSAEESARGQTGFFEGVVYSGLKGSGNSWTFNRANLGKTFEMKADSNLKITFPVRFSYEFNRDYSIRVNGDKYHVEVA